VAGGNGSLAVAAWLWRRQQCSGGCSSAAAARRQQLGSGGGSLAAVEAAVGDGQDEGGEVVTWNLFDDCNFFTLRSSVPVDQSDGVYQISVFV
jgi:hypothetical protein